MEGVVGALASLIGYQGNNTTTSSGDYGRAGDSNYNSKTPDSWKLLDDDCGVCGIVLSLWDNISGPRIEQVWYLQSTDVSFLKRNASFALNGEMIDGSSPESRRQNIECKFLLLPDYFSVSLLFCGLYNAATSSVLTRFSLSFIFQKRFLSKYFFCHMCHKDKMTILVDVYKRALADKSLGHEKALARLAEHLNASLKNISGILLAECAIPPLASTMLANAECSAPTKAFLSQMISSHFHTGCTLVVGNDQTKVQKWIDVLSYFLLPKQHALASSTVAVGLKNFIADLSLQGLVVTEKIDDFDFVFESMFPTTIIDLNEMQVRQTHPYNSYNVIRTEYLKSPQDRNMWDGANERLFICKSSKVVEEIVHNVFSFPSTSLFEREGYIRQAIELLIKKSVVLIKYFEALLKTMKDNESQSSGVAEHLTSSPGKNRNSSRNSSMSSMDDILKAAKHNDLKMSASIRRGEPAKGNRPESMTKITGSFSTGNLRGDDSVRDNVPKIHGLESQVRNRVRESLGYTEADYQVLMGIAEKLLPGIYIKVHGNTRWIEEKLIELFEQF